MAQAHLVKLTDRLETERLAAEIETTLLVAEARRLDAAVAYLSGELKRSEHECGRLAAEVQKRVPARSPRPTPRRSDRKTEGQFSLFSRGTTEPIG